MSLPFLAKPHQTQPRILRWAEEVVAAWAAAGARPIPKVEPLGYTGVQAEYFRKTWREIQKVTPVVTVEIQNNSPATPPGEQVRLMEIAMRVTVERALREGRPQ